MNRFNDYKSESGVKKPHAPAAVTVKAKTKPTPLSEAVKQDFQPEQSAGKQPGFQQKQQRQQSKPDSIHDDTLKNKMHCDDEKIKNSTSKNQNQQQKP